MSEAELIEIAQRFRELENAFEERLMWTAERLFPKCREDMVRLSEEVRKAQR